MREDFTKEKYEKWRKRLAIFMARINRADEADDVLNAFCVSMLEGKSQHQTVDQFAIDYLRASSARKGERSYSARQELVFAHSVESPGLASELGFDPRRDVDARIDLERCAKLAGKGIDADIFWLVYIEGFHANEIADHYQVTESRICQRLKRVSQRVSKRAAKGPESPIKAQREVADILPVKIERLEFEARTRMAFEEPGTMASLDEEGFEEWIA